MEMAKTMQNETRNVALLYLLSLTRYAVIMYALCFFDIP